MQSERRRDLANGRQGRFKAACRLGRDLPAQAKSDKSQGVRGTESPDSINQTLKKTEKLVSVFSGEVQRGSPSTISVRPSGWSTLPNAAPWSPPISSQYPTRSPS